jgi:hypothetical protein
VNATLSVLAKRILCCDACGKCRSKGTAN